jgi:hypothetical protein
VIVTDLAATRWVAIMSLFRLIRMSRLVSLARIMFMDAQRVSVEQAWIHGCIHGSWLCKRWFMNRAQAP